MGSVQAKANDFDEATRRSMLEASKPHLPHKGHSWMRFVTFCCGGLAKGSSFFCGGSEKLPAVRRLDNTIEHARVSFRSAEETSVQANANGFDEATQKSIPEASKPHLPHKSLSWMRFVTSCFGGLANGASFCCGGTTEKLPAVGRLDNTVENARVSCCYCAEMNKRPVCPDNALEDAIISFCFRIMPLSMHPFCCEGSAKPPAVCRTDNTIILG